MTGAHGTCAESARVVRVWDSLAPPNALPDTLHSRRGALVARLETSSTCHLRCRDKPACDHDNDAAAADEEEDDDANGDADAIASDAPLPLLLMPMTPLSCCC